MYAASCGSASINERQGLIMGWEEGVVGIDLGRRSTDVLIHECYLYFAHETPSSFRWSSKIMHGGCIQPPRKFCSAHCPCMVMIQNIILNGESDQAIRESVRRISFHIRSHRSADQISQIRGSDPGMARITSARGTNQIKQEARSEHCSRGLGGGSGFQV